MPFILGAACKYAYREIHGQSCEQVIRPKIASMWEEEEYCERKSFRATGDEWRRRRNYLLTGLD